MSLWEKINSKENFYALGKEYRQSAQDFASDAVEAARRSDMKSYDRNTNQVERLADLARSFDEKVEKFNQEKEEVSDAR